MHNKPVFLFECLNKMFRLCRVTCLYVRDGRVQRAGPVDQPLAPVDHSLIVHADKGLLHGVGQFLKKQDSEGIKPKYCPGFI